jgi:hypothetical protein
MGKAAASNTIQVELGNGVFVCVCVSIYIYNDSVDWTLLTRSMNCVF